MSEPFLVPAEIGALGPEAATRLRELVAAAEERQEREAAESLETALRIVPRPLRGVVKKVLGA